MRSRRASYCETWCVSRLTELADLLLSEDEVIEGLVSDDELKYLIAREVWNKRHPDEPIGERSPRI